jgi:hypothetical protein
MKKQDYNRTFKRVKKRVELYKRRRFFSSLLLTFLIILSIISGFVFFILLIDNVVYIGATVRIVLRTILILFLSIPIFVFFERLKSLWSMNTVVASLEKRYSVLKGRLYTAFECTLDDPLFSPQLVYANLKDVEKIVASLPKVSIISGGHRRCMRLLYLLVIPILFLFALSPYRYLPPFTRFFSERDIFRPVFVVSPGNGYVEKGQDIEIELKSLSGRIARPVLVVQGTGKPLRRKGQNQYVRKVEDVQEPFSYHIEFMDTFTTIFNIDVVECPKIKDINFTLHYPSYTGMGDVKTGDFNLYVLKGTRIEISGMCNQPLTRAELEFGDSEVAELDVGKYNFSGDIYIDTSKTFTINMVSENGLKNQERAVFNIFSYDDEYPHIEVVEPGADIDLPQDLMMDMGIEVSDDFGISRVEIVWVGKQRENIIPVISNPEKKSFTMEYLWNMEKLPIYPGDTLRYYVRVFDNDFISGPKMKRSEMYSVRFPTAEDIYREVVSGGEKAHRAFEKETVELEKLKQGLERLEKSLKESKKLSWEEMKQAEELVEKQKELIEDIEKTSREMEKIAEKLNETFLANPAIREKLQEIENLMRRIETEEMRRNLEELEKTLRGMDRREIIKAMEKMLLSQEMIEKRLDATVEMLKRIEQEERFKKIAEEAKRLQTEQEKLNSEMEGKKKDELGDLEPAEEELAKKLQQLQEEMEKLADELGAGDSIAKESLEDAAEMSSEAMKALEKLREAMKQGMENKSFSLGQKAGSKLSEMSGMLSAGLSSMLAQRSEEMEKMFNIIIEDVIFLSHQSETIISEIEEAKSKEDIIIIENSIKEGIKKTFVKIEELLKKNALISLIALEELENAVKSIEQSSKGLVGDNITSSLHYAKVTMKSLNLAALELIESKRDFESKSSGGSSMAQLMKQLQSIANGQMQVNKGTQALFPLNIPKGGSISKEMQGRIKRLSELQGSLAERLKDVGRGLEQEGGDILGDIGKMVEEMEEVAEGLGEYKVDRELMEREEKILSRMLDAQRSIHKREYSKKRVAERPEKVVIREPPPLPDSKDTKKELKKDILRELEEKYPEEYRELIRAYFDKLLERER